MARTASSDPTERELEILHVLWRHAPASLGTICDELRRERPLATTTVATMLKVMLDKRLVERGRGERGYEWSARVTRDATASGMLGRLVDRVFDGSAGRLVTHLMEDGHLSESELADMRRLLDEDPAAAGSSTARKKGRKKSGTKTSGVRQTNTPKTTKRRARS